MNESAMILSEFENRLRAGLVQIPCKQIHPLSRIKTLNGPIVRGISPVGKEKVYGGNYLTEERICSHTHYA